MELRRLHYFIAVAEELTGVLASSLAKRAPGYTSLGFPDPRKLPYTPSAETVRQAEPEERSA
jgi:hypothetical protein